jgi:alanine racemase
VTNNDFPVRAVIDLTAIRDNAAELKRRAGNAQLMAIVKANAYGHGLLPCARAALAGGATWLGAAQLTEALSLRAGLGNQSAPSILSWLYAPGADFAGALLNQIDLGVSAIWALNEIAAAARQTNQVARIHLKVDSGLGRSGATAKSWFELVTSALGYQAEGLVEVVGCWSHFAYADNPTHPTVRAQQQAFAAAVAQAEQIGARFTVRHLANSAALLTGADACWDMVRPGLALYGLSPIADLAQPHQLGIRPAMRLEADLIMVKAVSAGQGVSYGHTYIAPRDTKLGLVPAGYADGVARHASNRASVQVAGQRLRIAGRVCMDQFVVDLGPDSTAQSGDRVILFGPGDHGEPTAEDWANDIGTISYEITTRLPAHLHRVYVEGKG